MSVLAAADWGLLPGYTVIGITLGGIYALAAIGLVLIYRVSGVLNFAQGAVSMFSAFVAYQVSTVMGYPGAVGLVAAILIAVIGISARELNLGTDVMAAQTPAVIKAGGPVVLTDKVGSVVR